jgi:glycosyltransferase involved in cell wall biosynthesis
VRKVLYVIPSLVPSGAARQVTLLASHLPPERLSARVAVLGTPSPWADSLASAGVPVDVLGWKRPFDVRPLLALRALVRAWAPDVVHAWRPAALRGLVLSGACPPSQVLVSAALPPAGRASWLVRALLRRAGGVLALGQAEAARYLALGVKGERLAILNPAVEAPAPALPAHFPGLPSGARVALGIGPIEPHKGFREAVWAFDILCHLYPDLHLVIAGDGSDRRRVMDFARAIRVSERVHFPGPVADLGPWLARAEMVWVPSLREGGHNATLEALAAGKPVIATRVPGLTELIEDGVTGLLIPPDDKPALARATRQLLEDADLRAGLGAAGRYAGGGHGVLQLSEAVERLYGEPGAGSSGEVATSGAFPGG